MKLLFLLNGPIGHSCFCTDCFCVNLVWAVAMMVTILLVTGMILWHLCRKNKRQKQEAENERKHEIQLKDKVYEQEKAWVKFNETMAKVESLEEKVNALQSQLDEQKDDTSNKKE